jgi:DNA invertase Pin-like site-specific DNA recombinase
MGCERMGDMKIGYARVSTFEQTLDLQVDALKAEGCERIYTDKVGGIKDIRPNWEKVIELAREGDTIITWRLDRIGRGMRNLLDIMEYLEKNNIDLKTLTGIEVDTSTPTGRLLFRMVAAITEYEREQVIERTTAGLQAAFARGRRGGRKHKLTPKQVEILHQLYKETDNGKNRKHRVEDICRSLKISPATLYRYLKKEPSQLVG